MQNWLLQRARLTPQATALQFLHKTYSWQEIVSQASIRAGQLVRMGVEPKTRVALLAPSTDELVITIYACMLLQCEMVMCNRRLAQHELTYQLEDAEVTTVIVAQADSAKLPACPFILLEDVAQQTAETLQFSEQWQEEATASIMYTSGTTGFPKGVRQTYGNHQASALSAALNVGVAPQDVWLCTMPIFHISGLSILMRSILYGNGVQLHENFDEKQVVDALLTGEVTHMSVVAVTLARILQELEARGEQLPKHFKLMLAGGGAVPKSYLQRAIACNIAIAQTYGMTETASQTATLSPQDALRKIGSSGKVLFFSQIKIAGAKKAGEHGEICVQGPNVTPGYIGRHANKAATQNGWLHTGDIGYLDDEGYLYVVDRRNDLIISGGENIYPAEIENILHGHEAIIEAGVCGCDDAKWGAVPVAFIVVKSAVSAQQIQAYCAEHLAKYKVPKQVHIVSALPRNGANKLLRRELRKWLTIEEE